jgi:hypothetical protein
MPSLLDPDQTTPDAGAGLLGIGRPQIAPPDPGAVSQADALAQTYQAITAEIARQQQISADRGLWADGRPTAAGMTDAAQKYAQGLLFGTTAPGFKAYHGSPADFERFDAHFLHPDEAGHYFAQDERLAQDYAGRSKADPTAGHMYEVNIKADPASFLDYGSLSAKDQAALNDPGAMEKLRAAGVPGISLPDRTHVVFNDATIEILRKYGIAGLMAGGGAAATQQPSQ